MSSTGSAIRLLNASSPLPLDRPFTTTMARAEGITTEQLRALTGRGYLRRIIKGVYVASQLPDSTSLRCLALALVVPEDCVVVDRHAGWLLGAEMVLAPNEHIDPLPIAVFRPSGMGRLRNNLTDSGERNLGEKDVLELNGVRVTTPLRTACDLGRVRSTDRAIASLDAMLRLGAFTHDELVYEVERFRRMRWVTTLRTLAPLSDGRAQSPGESVLRLRWIEARLPSPEPQYEIWCGGRLFAILDIATGATRYAAEYDGVEWHTSELQQLHDRQRRAALREEDWLIDVFVRDDLFDPQARPDLRLRSGAHEAAQRSRRPLTGGA
ncbi:MAG: type IV toxin-antitoxin system AbiEi family antitoxin domain-containing protein [Nocardioides sp.]